jgi:hypothetical protein
LNLNKLILFLLLSLFPVKWIYSQTWTGLPNGIPNPVYCMKEYNGKLILGGAGSLGISFGVASWDGVSWDSLGPGTNQGQVNCIEIYNNQLIIGGDFLKIGNSLGNFVPYTHLVAAWDGTNWHGLGSGGGASWFPVNAMAVYNGELYVGGAFIDIGGITCNRIARWNGITWNTVGTGVAGSMPTIYSMCVYDGQLYVGGNFQSAGGVPASGIARWNGVQWDSVGSGIYGWPFSMIVDSINNNLIIGGNFTCPDTSIGFGICVWNGNQYLPFGKGLYDVPHALSFYKGYLFATRPGLTSTSQDTILIYWDSTSWKHISGPNESIASLHEYSGKLYVGGYFDKIDTLNLPYIVRYSNPTLNIIEPEQNKNSIKIFPNPSGGSVTISYNIKNYYRGTNLRIYDSSGKIRFTKKIIDAVGDLIIGEGLLPNGIYLVTIQNKKENLTEKFVIE